MKRMAAALLAAALCVSLCGCEGKAPEPVEVPGPEPGPISLKKEEPKTKAELVLESMTDRQKLCQLVMPCMRYLTHTRGSAKGLTELTDEAAALLSEFGFAGIILFADNMKSASQVRELTQAMQKAALEGGNPGLLIAADQEGGYVRRASFACFMPGNMALGAADSEKDAFDYGAIVGEELEAMGINLDFAPVCDLNSNPRNPIIGVRSFGDDALRASRMAGSLISGLSSRGISAALKHFPGHGDTSTDSHTGLPTVDRTLEQLEAYELIPFREGIDAGADVIMTAHISFPQIEIGTLTAADGSEVTLPATMSRTILTDVLRDRMGFEGVVCTDSLVMDAVEHTFSSEDIAAMAIGAGADMLLMPVSDSVPLSKCLSSLREYVGMLEGLLESGRISRQRLDESALRVLTLKEKKGLLDGMVPEGGDPGTVGSAAHREREMEIAMDAVTLVKDPDGLVPLSADRRTVCFVPSASLTDSVRYAARVLAREGILSNEDMLEPVSRGSCSLDDIDALIDAVARDGGTVITVNAMYSLSGLSGADAAKQDEILAGCRARGVPVLFISAMLPYDLARYDADALMACYLAIGMDGIPSEGGTVSGGYGPNVPAALMAAFGMKKPAGTLPVGIPVLKKTGGGWTCTDEILYPSGTGMT